MRLVRQIISLDERKVVGRLVRDSFALFTAILQVSIPYVCCVPRRFAWASAEQAKGEGKSVLVEIGLA